MRLMNQDEIRGCREEGFSCLVRSYRPHVASVVLDAFEEAGTILEQAERRAAEIRAEAEERVAVAAEDARRAATREAEAEAARKVAEAAGWARAFRRETEGVMVEAVISVAERVWGELGGSRSASAAMVAAALREELSGQGRLRARLHPDDLEAACGLEGLELVADESLSPGDCVMEIPGAVYDARAATRADLALGALAEALRGEEGLEDEDCDGGGDER
ncbi:MAG: FliH/SctL family protein [Myxococcota bacterium]